jgi:hypothetical protein
VSFHDCVVCVDLVAVSVIEDRNELFYKGEGTPLAVAQRGQELALCFSHGCLFADRLGRRTRPKELRWRSAPRQICALLTRQLGCDLLADQKPWRAVASSTAIVAVYDTFVDVFDFESGLMVDTVALPALVGMSWNGLFTKFSPDKVRSTPDFGNDTASHVAVAVVQDSFQVLMLMLRPEEGIKLAVLAAPRVRRDGKGSRRGSAKAGINKAMISAPSDFQHLAHSSVDDAK